MPAVRHLPRLRGATRGSSCVAATAITRDDVQIGTAREPGRDGAGHAIGQEIHDTSSVEVADQGPVAHPLAPRPVVNPNPPKALDPGNTRASANGLQQRVPADRKHQAAGEPRGRTTAERQPAMVHDDVETLRPARERGDTTTGSSRPTSRSAVPRRIDVSWPDRRGRGPGSWCSCRLPNRCPRPDPWEKSRKRRPPRISSLAWSNDVSTAAGASARQLSTATIANYPRVGNVVMPASTSKDRVLPAAAILCAVLHGAGALVLTVPLFDTPVGGLDDDTSFDEHEQPRRASAPPWHPSTGGARALTLLPQVPIAVIVPVARDIVLAPSAATVFVTAIGPLRRDRVAATANVHALANGRLSEAVAERLVDLWDARSDRARTSLDAVERIIAGPTTVSAWRRGKRRAFIRGDDAKIDAMAFSAMTEAMAVGLAPHVWAPSKRQDKAPFIRFYRELFVSEPHESFLFSHRLREIPGVRILLSGESGSGKTAAAAHVATEVLGMATRDLRMSEILYHRLGALERAIAAAFREAREQGAVLIIDEANSIAQDRGSASANSVHLVTAMTNSLLLELDRHTLPIVLCTNYSDRLDAAIRRRVDLAFEVRPIPDNREALAARLLLGLELPTNVPAISGTVIADYVSARRVLQLQGSGADAAAAAIVRARDVRLGRYEQKARRRIGF